MKDDKDAKEKRKTVFLVDDDFTNLKIGKKALQDEYKILTFTSGAYMLEVVQDIKPDIILLDVQMPMMDGYEVLKRLKDAKNTADIPVIFLTALNDKQSVIDGLTMKPQGYITKPCSPEFLRERVREHLEQGAAREADNG